MAGPRVSRLRALLPCLVLLLAGCPMDSGPRVEVGGKSFKVEIRDDNEGRARGLMFVDAMEPDEGMLFIYPSERRISMWMKNTHMALDILFFDAQARFISAHYGVPTCKNEPCPNYPSAAPARYVLELKAGVGAALALKPGATMELPRP